MARTLARLVLFVVLLADFGAAATLQKYLLTKTKPAACSEAIQNPPVAATSFLTTDPQFYLWFYITDTKRGDQAESFYYDPSGALYAPASGPWDPADSDSTGTCYTDTVFKIAGEAPAAKPGNWTVKVRYNGIEIFSLTFAIGSSVTPPPAAGGLNLVVNQVISSACPEIRVIASVTDSNGTPVTGLNASNFTLKEDGNTQSIRVVSSGGGGSSGTALWLALVLDRSGSVSGTPLSDEKAAAKALVAQLGSGDNVAVFAFDNTITKVRDFTSDRAAINAAIDSVQAGGNTALFAAAVQAAQALAPKSGRKAIILLTDGRNNEAGTEADAINQAKLANAPIFPVGFGDVDDAVLGRLASGTGGVYKKGATSAELQGILQGIGQTISSQYEIIYTTSNSSVDHTLQITSTLGAAGSSVVTSAVTRCASSAAGATITLQGATGRPGGAVDVPVTLTASGTSPASLQFDFTYDTSKLTFNQARNGDQFNAASKSVTTNRLSANQMRVIGAGLNQNPIGNGTIAFLNFTLAGSFTGSTNLTCTNPGSADSLARGLATTCTAGAITSAASCGCDVNADGQSNVLDVQLIINQVLGVVAASCDVNGDGAINVADAQTVINAALGLGCR